MSVSEVITTVFSYVKLFSQTSCVCIVLPTLVLTFIVRRFKPNFKWFIGLRIVSFIVLAFSSVYALWDYVNYLNHVGWSGLVAVIFLCFLIIPSIFTIFVSFLASYLYKRNEKKSA